MQKSIQRFQDLQVYQLAFRCSVEVHTLAQQFPEDKDRYLVLKLLSTSRAVRAQIAAAWGWRRHQEALLTKLSTAQLAAADMQTWLEAAICLGYLNPDPGQALYDRYRYLYIVLDQLMETASTGATRLEESLEYDFPASA